jgi:hypothetical protein
VLDHRYSPRHGGVWCFEVDFYDDSTISEALEPLRDLELTRGIFSRVEKNAKFLRHPFSFIIGDPLLVVVQTALCISQTGFQEHRPLEISSILEPSLGSRPLLPGVTHEDISRHFLRK